MVIRGLVVLLAAVALAACGPAVADAPTGTPTSSEKLGSPNSEQALPGGLRIPAIGVNAPSMIPLGLTANHQPEVPSEDDPTVVGWYVLGPTPGDPGPAVIMAHVNAHHRAGAFAKLHELKPGDRIEVDRGGATLTFEVRAVDQVDKDAFPADLVFGQTAGPELRLITCGGALNVAQRSYEDNIIVSARLVA